MKSVHKLCHGDFGSLEDAKPEAREVTVLKLTQGLYTVTKLGQMFEMSFTNLKEGLTNLAVSPSSFASILFSV